MSSAPPDARAPRSSKLIPILLLCSAVFLLVLLWQRPNVYAWWWTKQLMTAPSESEALPYALRLQAMGDRVVRRVAPYALGTDDIARHRALRVLAKVESPDSTRTLCEVADRVTDADDVRLVLRALARRPDDPRAQAVVAGALTLACDDSADEPAVLRATVAAHALALRGDANARVLLTNALHCPGPPALLVEVIHALLDLGEDHTIPRLIELLTNNAALEGPTERDRYAADVLASVMGRPDAAPNIPAGALLEVEQRHVVRVCAEEALYVFTDRQRPADRPADIDPIAIQAEWQQWFDDMIAHSGDDF